MMIEAMIQAREASRLQALEKQTRVLQAYEQENHKLLTGLIENIKKLPDGSKRRRIDASFN